MTRDEILNMPAGCEMDALIAKEIMGLEQASKSEIWWWNNGILDELPDYSLDVGTAWEVAEKLSDKFDFALVNNQNFIKYPDLRYGFRLQAIVEDSHIKTIFALAETAPLAICRAALLAVMK